MSKEEIIKEVITILGTSSYIDPAEHLYDGLKQIKREITYATVHDFLWSLESSTVLDVDGRVTECARKIKSLLADMTIDEAYKNYLKHNDEVDNYWIKKNPEIESRWKPYSQEEFINKCKTDSEFSKKWGLKIEERELSLKERMNLCREKLNDTDDSEILLPSDIEYRMNNEWNVPTRLITITYNNEKIEVYES
jgi:hypothetical protein